MPGGLVREEWLDVKLERSLAMGSKTYLRRVQSEPGPQSVAVGRPCPLSTVSRPSGHHTPLLCPGRNSCRVSVSPRGLGLSSYGGAASPVSLVWEVWRHRHIPTTDWGKVTSACVVLRVVGILVRPLTLHSHAQAPPVQNGRRHTESPGQTCTEAMPCATGPPSDLRLPGTG